MSSLAPVTQTLACAVCRRLATVVYVRGFRRRLPAQWWQCPYCWQDNRLTGAIKVLKATDASGLKAECCAPPRFDKGFDAPPRKRAAAKPTMQAFCAYCGGAVTLGCEPANDDQQRPISFWRCPYPECHQENAVRGVIVESVASREHRAPARPHPV
jgi:hypothetical protein